MSVVADCGGIVLCGGQSTRMGQDKAWLPFGAEFMLQRVVRILSKVVSPVVVVAAADQRLPELPAEIQIVRDRSAGIGPLEGLRCGLVALGERPQSAYVTSCDVPLLNPSFVRQVISLRGSALAAAPYVDGRYQPLAAVYSLQSLPIIEELLLRKRRALREIFEHAGIRKIEPQELTSVDPELDSLLNLNEPESYRAALVKAGL